MDIQWRVIFFFIKILLPTLKKHICVSADTKKKMEYLAQVSEIRPG